MQATGTLCQLPSLKPTLLGENTHKTAFLPPYLAPTPHCSISVAMPSQAQAAGVLYQLLSLTQPYLARTPTNQHLCGDVMPGASCRCAVLVMCRISVAASCQVQATGMLCQFPSPKPSFLGENTHKSASLPPYLAPTPHCSMSVAVSSLEQPYLARTPPALQCTLKTALDLGAFTLVGCDAVQQ